MARRVKKSPSRSLRNKLSAADASTPNTDVSPPAIHTGTDEVFKVRLLEEVEYVRPSGDGAQADGSPEQASQNKIFRPMEAASGELIPAAVFDEAGYLLLNPDVRRAIDESFVYAFRIVMLGAAVLALAAAATGGAIRGATSPRDRPSRTS